MSEPDQLDILTAIAEIGEWPCPTCRGNRQMLRILYPDEALARGELTEVCTCRTCRGRGVVGYDATDRSEFGF